MRGPGLPMGGTGRAAGRAPGTACQQRGRAGRPAAAPGGAAIIGR